MRNSRIVGACVGVLALRRKWDLTQRLAKRLGTIPAGTRS